MSQRVPPKPPRQPVPEQGAGREEEQVSAGMFTKASFAGMEDSEPNEDETWLTTYLDILTLLLVLFVILLANADFQGINTPDEQISASDPGGLGITPDSGDAADARMEQLGSSLTDEFEGTGLEEMVDITSSDGELNIVLSDEILFSSGQAEFTQQATQAMAPIVKILQQTEHDISVEGHTDSIPINTPRFPSNWELSAARASFVVRYLKDEGDISASRLRAVGYADSQPVADNSTPDGRQQNRRVTLVLTVPRNVLQSDMPELGALD